MKQFVLVLSILFTLLQASAQWASNTSNSDTSFAWRGGNTAIGTASRYDAKLTVGGNILQLLSDKYIRSFRLFLESPSSRDVNGFTQASFGSNVWWNNDSAKWILADSSLSSFAMMRINNGEFNFYPRPVTIGGVTKSLSETDLASFRAMNIAKTGFVGIGTNAPAAPLDITGTDSNRVTMVLGRLAEGNGTALGTCVDLSTASTALTNSRSFSLEHRFYGKINSSINFYRGSGQTGGFMTFGTNDNTEKMRLDNTGNLALGTTTPKAQLHVYAPAAANTWTGRGIFGNQRGMVTAGAYGDLPIIGALDSTTFNWQKLYINTNNGATGGDVVIGGKLGVGTSAPASTLHVSGSGYVSGKFTIMDSVGIGTTKPTTKLAVNGTILAKQVKVSQSAASWPDYVFDSSYNLPALNTVAQYIQFNKHLPGMAAAAEVEKNGQDIGQTQTALLQKVEELTLYVISQDKAQQQQQQLINDQRKQLELMQAQLKQQAALIQALLEK